MGFFALSMIFVGNVARVYAEFSADIRLIDPRIKAPAVVTAEAFLWGFIERARVADFEVRSVFFFFPSTEP